MRQGDLIGHLQCENRNLRRENEELKSGEKYMKMERAAARKRRYYERKLAQKNKELEKKEKDYQRMNDRWFEVLQDIQDEYEKRIEKLEKDCAARCHKEEQKTEKMAERLRKKSEELHEQISETVNARAEAQKEKEKNQKLKAQVDKNFENSSIPFSKSSFRGTVQNSREETGRKQGAQKGHVGHGRKKHTVNGETHFLDAPEEIKKDPKYRPEGGANSEIHKQVVGLKIEVTVDDFWAKVYRNKETGGRYHAPFPPNVTLDVNYDDSVKTFLFLMKDHLNVSEQNIHDFLFEMTDGKLNISKGMINSINREFAAKSEKERAESYARLLASHVMFIDMTNVRHNGKLKNVVVCTNKDNDTLFYYREKKGDKGFEGTPVESYDGILEHDHDKTSYHYGGKHQECNAHHLRYLKGAMKAEPKLTWHKKMYDLLRETDHTRNEQGFQLAVEQIEDFEKRYDGVTAIGEKEYHDNPPSQYYRDGYNLFKRLRDGKEHVLLFLHDPEVEFTNNRAERACRKIKRHAAVSGSFRGNSTRDAEDYCKAMSVLVTARAKGENVREKISEIFRREMPPKPKVKPTAPAPPEEGASSPLPPDGKTVIPEPA